MGRRFSSGISKKALKRAGIKLQPGDLGSELENKLANALHFAGVPPPERELKLVAGREWRSDFVWRTERLIVEVEGGTMSGKSRHSKGEGFAEDCRKYNRLTLDGWRLLRVTGEHIQSGEALAWIEEALS